MWTFALIQDLFITSISHKFLPSSYFQIVPFGCYRLFRTFLSKNLKAPCKSINRIFRARRRRNEKFITVLRCWIAWVIMTWYVAIYHLRNYMLEPFAFFFFLLVEKFRECLGFVKAISQAAGIFWGRKPETILMARTTSLKKSLSEFILGFISKIITSISWVQFVVQLNLNLNSLTIC